MLYRTHHHPFLFPLNPFTPTPLSSSHPHPTSSPLLSSSSSSYSSLSQVVEKGMDRVEEVALKSSFGSDLPPKAATYLHQQPQQQVFSDDCSAGNGQNAVLGDDFFVDDLLDFSNAVVEDPEEQKQEELLENDVTTVTQAASVVTSATFSVKDDDFGSLPASELTVPSDDLESLEWLSHFVDDSFPEYSLTYPVTKLPPMPAKSKTDPEVLVQKKPNCFATPVQTKARSKRTRAGVPGWSFGSCSLTESSTSSTTSSSSSTTTSSSPCHPWLFYSGPGQTAESLFGKPQGKKQKKRPATESSGGGQQPRRCSHCGVQKTPQWRAGPMGAKTLCNACGVRFKSGRLLPEYRPACSPTFSSELHSNNHRKVLEMRRKKEMEEAGLAAPPVQSF